MQRITLTSPILVLGDFWGDVGQTDLTRFLNDAIAGSEDLNWAYTNGKGIMVRSPFDGFEDDETKSVVPATFWSNDIMSPGQLYPGAGPTEGNPWCPTNYASWNCDTDPETDDWNPYDYAQLAAVVGTHMDQIFYDFDNIQSEDWGWGVFYASDSNSVDKRCRYLESDGGFDCPGGWIPMDGDFVPVTDGSKLGTGIYEAGNPYAGFGGGGAGCHFSGDHIDQTNAYDEFGSNLVNDYDCQCNYNFNNLNAGWEAWVDNWRVNGIGGSGASWALDLGACWMNNLRDMISLQNMIWWKRWEWNDLTIPEVQYDAGTAWMNRPYWGWNEIPVSRAEITNMDNWDAIMIKMPADACNSENGRNDQLSCYDYRFHNSIELALDTYVQAGKLGVGRQAYPSSSVVIAREAMDDGGNYFRQFICEAWVSPNNLYQIVWVDDGFDSACYLDWPSAASVV